MYLYSESKYADSSVLFKQIHARHAQLPRMGRMGNQLLLIQENERKRIATDLHDSLGQSLVIIRHSLAKAMHLLDDGEIEEASESLQQLDIKIGDALEEVRRVSLGLRPPMLDDLGILATLSWHCRELETACPGIRVEKNVPLQENDIPGMLKITLFRIIQEATSNIIKHAHADLISISLNKTGDTLYLVIEDNGDGFDPASVMSNGLGLLSMRERADASGGVYTMDSREGVGTRIGISWRLGKLAAII
jgi:signal transduction histidine kinase